MAVHTTPIRFTRGDAGEVLEAMVELADRADGRSWVNVRADVEQRPERGSAVTELFVARGPAIPVGTWVPGRRRKGTVEPTSVGLQHAAGRKAVDQLGDLGVPVPESWKVEQDNAKRGLTFVVPAGEEPAVALRFMVNAATALSDVWLEDAWVALVTEQVRRST